MDLLDFSKFRWPVSLTLVGVAFVGCSWLAGILFESFALKMLTTTAPWTIYRYLLCYGYSNQVANLLFFACFFSLSLFLFLVVLIFRRPKQSPYGNARWATEKDVRRAGLRASNGIILGRANDRLLVDNGSEHVLCFAPTRSGKGTGIVIPNLLNWPGSTIVHDIKGENFQKTSGFRSKYGQKVYVWNPGVPEGKTYCYNPLEFISSNPGQRVDDIQKIAHLILPEEDFWTKESRTLFVGVVLYLLDKSPSISFGLVLRTIRGEGNFVDTVKQLLQTERTTLNAVAFMALNAFAQKADKEQSGVLSTLNAALELWANPLIDAATSRSDFDLRRLKIERTTIYVSVSSNNLSRLKPLLQIFYQQALDFLTEKEVDKNKEPYPVLFLMDEFPSLGRMTQFEQGIAFLAGYRVRLLLIIQDIPQLETHYHRSGMNTFLGNSKIKVTFAANNYETADLISRLLGTYGEETNSESRSRKMGLSAEPESESKSQSKMARALLLPQEILQLPPEEEILVVEAAPPIRAKKIRYFKENIFQDRVLSPISIPIIKPVAQVIEPIIQTQYSETEIKELLETDEEPPDTPPAE